MGHPNIKLVKRVRSAPRTNSICPIVCRYLTCRLIWTPITDKPRNSEVPNRSKQRTGMIRRVLVGPDRRQINKKCTYSNHFVNWNPLFINSFCSFYSLRILKVNFISGFLIGRSFLLEFIILKSEWLKSNLLKWRCILKTSLWWVAHPWKFIILINIYF